MYGEGLFYYSFGLIRKSGGIFPDSRFGHAFRRVIYTSLQPFYIWRSYCYLSYLFHDFASILGSLSVLLRVAVKGVWPNGVRSYFGGLYWLFGAFANESGDAGSFHFARFGLPPSLVRLRCRR